MHYINSSLNKTKPPCFKQGGFLLLFLAPARPVPQTMDFSATKYYYVVKDAQVENIPSGDYPARRADQPPRCQGDCMAGGLLDGVRRHGHRCLA